MSKFNVGDQVRVLSAGGRWCHGLKQGYIARVIGLGPCGELCVRGEDLRDGGPLEQSIPECEVEPVAHQKIVVTTDGSTTTARLFAGKELVKSAEAKCSPRDEFNFETGAALALDRLLDRDKKAEPEAPSFTKADLRDGMFCRLSDGSWGVIVGDLVVFDDGGFCRLSELQEDLTWAVAGDIQVVLEGVCCFGVARMVGLGDRRVRHVRPGAKFE